MSPPATQIARDRFLQALQGGPARVPEAVQRALDQLPALDAQSPSPDTERLERELADEFSIWDTFFSVQALTPASSDRWVAGLRWVLQELHSWTPQAPQARVRLQVLFAALSAFDTENAGLDAVLVDLPKTVTSDGSHRLLQVATGSAPKYGARGFASRAEIQAASREGNFPQLKLLTRHLEVQLPSDARLATYLLWRSRPDLLAEVIDQSQDAVFSHAVCQLLGAAALDFALRVQDQAFKFFSANAVADLPADETSKETLNAFRDLLLQLAKTPQWGSWLQALYKYPQGRRLSEEALSAALAWLDASKWAGFVDGVQLWTHTRTAAPVANILASFYQAVGASAATEMWTLAFRRWDDWDYKRADSNTQMFSPSACSFDFPVAMYYASIPQHEAENEEKILSSAVECIEEEWFSSLSELVTKRNRLLSRLRLVRHGRALAGGNTADALPPAVTPDSEYASLRYHYHDVNAVRDRGR